MKKNKYTYTFFIIIYSFFFFYSYKLISQKKIDIESKENILGFNIINKIDEKIHTIFKSKFKVIDSENGLINLYNDNDNLFELSSLTFQHYSKENITYLTQFSNKIHELNKEFLYIDVPHKSFFHQELLYKYNYYIDYEKYYKFRNELSNNNIDYIDTTEIFKQQKEEAFYKHDFHLTLETGYNYTKNITEYINKKYNYKLELKLLDKEKFYYQTNPINYAGYYSRLLNDNYCENLTYIVPKYETNFSVYNNQEILNGNILDVIYNQNKKSTKYNSYLNIIGGTESQIKIINNLTKNNKKLLIVGNSSVKAYVPFLSLLFKEVHSIDIRNEVGGYKNNVIDYVIENDIDLVMFSEITWNDEMKYLKVEQN